MNSEKKIKHLELIQGVINRMANNSFMLKGWAVTLVAGVFTLAAKDADKLYFLVAYIPVIIFWGHDSYYLLQERLYKGLYEKVRLTSEDEIDFVLKASKKEYGSQRNNFWSCVTSSTELWFYFPLAIVCTGIIIVTHMQ